MRARKLKLRTAFVSRYFLYEGIYATTIYKTLKKNRYFYVSLSPNTNLNIKNIGNINYGSLEMFTRHLESNFNKELTFNKIKTINLELGNLLEEVT